MSASTSGSAPLLERARRHTACGSCGDKNDIFLWSCILNFRYRRHGSTGVAEILRGLHARRSLYNVEGEMAEAFWRTILNEILHDEQLLAIAWEFAEVALHTAWRLLAEPLHPRQSPISSRIDNQRRPSDGMCGSILILGQISPSLQHS